MKKAGQILAMIAVLAAMPLLLQAENSKSGISHAQIQCAEALQECFGYEGTAQCNCFYSVSRHPFCEDTQLGRVIFKRWAMSPFRLAGTSCSAGLSEAQRAANACYVEVDKSWSSFISRGDISEDTISGIAARLDACQAGTQIELPRP